MAQNLTINGVTYNSVASLSIPKAAGGSAAFPDTSDATAVAADLLSGKTAYAKGVKVTGNIQSKSAQTYTPTTSNQTISSGQYLSGAQTVLGDPDLVAGNIKKDVDIFGVIGTLESGGGGATAYAISCNETIPQIFLYTQHGVAGDRILTYHEDSAFMYFNITIKDASNNTISYTIRDSNCWYFTMPASNVTITVDYM